MFKIYDEQIGSIVEKIKSAQDLFFKDNFRYFQAPKNTISKIEFKDTQSVAVVSNVTMTENLPLEILVREHNNVENGKGYTVYFIADFEGKKYVKAVNFGISEGGKTEGGSFDWIDQQVSPIRVPLLDKQS